MCVCVCVRERAREGESERAREGERERGRESGCVCMWFVHDPIMLGIITKRSFIKKPNPVQDSVQRKNINDCPALQSHIVVVVVVCCFLF